MAIGCARCGGPKLEWQVYCGAACSEMAEMKIPVAPERLRFDPETGAAIGTTEPEVNEKERLRVVVDELADELADLVVAFDDVKRDIGELAARDDRWARLQRLLWPDG